MAQKATETMAFASKYAGKCATCGGRFPAGELIGGSSRNYSHVACLDAAAEAGLPAPAPAEDKDAAAWATFQASYVALPGEGVFS